MKIFANAIKLLILSSLAIAPNLAIADEPEKKLILFPIAYYTPETSVAFGGLMINNFKKVSEGKTSHLLSSISYTAKKQSIFVTSPRVYLRGGRIEIFSFARYMFFPSEYFGRGNHTLAENKQVYTYNLFATEIGVKHKVISDFFFAPYMGHLKQKIVKSDDGGLLASELASGFGEYTQNYTGFYFGWDTRDFVNAPLNGAYYFVSLSRHWTHDALGLIESKFFDKQEIDLRQYVNLAEKKVLALNLNIAKIDGKSVPFQSLLRLGGANSLRGYLAGRYRDKAFGVFQADYRFDISEKLAASFFAGLGTVASDLNGLSQNRRRHAVGAGLHYIADKENRQKFRLDLGFGEGERAIYVVFGEAF